MSINNTKSINRETITISWERESLDEIRELVNQLDLSLSQFIRIAAHEKKARIEAGEPVIASVEVTQNG
jgi:hypothetical protein